MGKAIYVCTKCKGSKDCKKKLGKKLGGKVELLSVGCQKICKGPVVGVKLDGQVEWFRKLDDKDDLKDLGKALSSDKVTKSLKELHVKKHAGRIRGRIRK